MPPASATATSGTRDGGQQQRPGAGGAPGDETPRGGAPATRRSPVLATSAPTSGEEMPATGVASSGARSRLLSTSLRKSGATCLDPAGRRPARRPRRGRRTRRTAATARPSVPAAARRKAHPRPPRQAFDDQGVEEERDARDGETSETAPSPPRRTRGACAAGRESGGWRRAPPAAHGPGIQNQRASSSSVSSTPPIQARHSRCCRTRLQSKAPRLSAGATRRGKKRGTSRV